MWCDYTRERVVCRVLDLFFGSRRGGMARERGEMRGLTWVADDSLAATIPYEHIGMTEGTGIAAARVGVWLVAPWASLRHLE